jgi:hypothetical protein
MYILGEKRLFDTDFGPRLCKNKPRNGHIQDIPAHLCSTHSSASVSSVSFDGRSGSVPPPQ